MMNDAKTVLLAWSLKKISDRNWELRVASPIVVQERFSTRKGALAYLQKLLSSMVVKN